MALVIVLAGGGTGGHVFPAIALAETIRKRDPQAEVRFLGTERGVGAKHIRAAGYPLDVVPSRPVVGRNLVAAALALGTLARGVLRARRLLRQAGARLVIGVGGYASVPGVAAALLLRIPTAVLEPDAAPGRANRLLGRFARRVFVQFDDSLRHFPAGRAERLGFPVREIPRREQPPPGTPVRLLVVGGSQGARSINRALTRDLEALGEAGALRITHQTGALDFEEVRTAYASAGVDAELAPFFDDLPRRLAQADLVVARAGASSVAELCMAGVPSILVPYSHAAAHQMRNARELERAGACTVIPDSEVGDRLTDAVRTLVQDPVRRDGMARAAAGRATPDAAERIWNACRALIQGEGQT